MRPHGLSLTRRGFALRLASLVAAGVARPALGQDELQAFRSLSARLTGFSAADIDAELALDMIDGLRAAGDGGELAELLANAAEESQSELARRIAVAWYSGMHPGVDGPSLRAYYDALVWRALAYTTPPGQCGSASGDWSEPPAGAAP